MKKTFLLLSLFTFLYGHSQISKTLTVTNAGSLSTLLTDDEKNTITDLTVSGTIDVRDIKCMRDQLILLKNIDLSSVNIAAYEGIGTAPTTNSYASNHLPSRSFQNYYLSQGKETLETIILPTTLLAIDESAFSLCPRLKNITISNSVLSIAKNAFYNCKGLTTVKMGSSVTTIGDDAFDNCYALSDLTIGDHVTSIGFNSFFGCSNLTNVIIPNSVTNIGTSAFSHCTGLTTLTIGSSVSNIDISAFSACSNIKTIYSLNSTPPTCQICFSGVTSVTEVLVPSSSVSAYKSAPVWSDCFFSKIKAIPVSKTYEPLSNKVKVHSSRTEIIIDGTDKGEIVNVFSLDGKSLKKVESLGEQIVIQVQNKNVYLVKTGTETFKIIL